MSTQEKYAHLSLLEEGNEERSVQRKPIVHACVGCRRVEVGVPRHLQSCTHLEEGSHAQTCKEIPA